MRRLTHAEYEARLAKRHPDFRMLERYCKASIPLAVLCERCGNTITREANAHLRFGCPHCARTTYGEDDPA